MQFVQDLRTCDMTLRSYFGKQNSTLGSVVPLCVCGKGQEIHSGRDKDMLFSISEITASHAQSAIWRKCVTGHTAQIRGSQNAEVNRKKAFCSF